MKLYLFSWLDQTWMVLAPSTQRAGEILIEDFQFAYLWNKGESFDVKELGGKEWS